MSYFSFIEDFRQMSMLFEGIDDMRKFYKNIPENEFISYIELDPTYKQGSNKAGTYAKWILGLANSNNLKDKNHVKDLLSRFEENKKNLKDKDIMKFKSMDELESYLNDDANYNDLSHRQEVRQRQKDRRNVDLSKDAELVYEDSDWEVWIPKTYAASCKLGQGTSWCTASTETSEYYDEYTDDGYLYININKHNPKEKYQFHFESQSFMDKDDEDIDLFTFFKEERNRGLLNRFKGYDDYIYDIYENIDRDFTTMRYPSDFEGVPNDIYSKQLKNVMFDEGVTSIGGDGTFRYCNNLTSITIPNSVTSIGDFAFGACSSLTEVVIPDSVTTIGNWAFSYCRSLTSVVIPDSVTSIGDRAFSDCRNLKSIVIPDSVTSIGERAFNGCRSLTSITIPYSVTSIGDYAFYNCSSLTSVVIGDSVASIGEGAFVNCSSLTSVEIGDSVETIGDWAFYNCKGLTSVVIPDSVASIGDEAFGNCVRLSDIKYTGSAKQWKQIEKGKDWAKGVPTKSIKLVDSVGIDENFKRRNKHIQ